MSVKRIEAITLPMPIHLFFVTLWRFAEVGGFGYQQASHGFVQLHACEIQGGHQTSCEEKKG